MPWFRCTLVDEDELLEITIDVLVDDNHKIDAGIMFFGYWRDREETRGEPFALDYNNEMDWGSSHVSILPIRGQRLAEGLTVKYRGFANPSKRDKGEISREANFIVIKYVSYT